MTTHAHPDNASWPALVGRAVTGTYYGTPFTGIAWQERAHTLTGQCRMVTVRLPFPIDVMGADRDELLVSVCGACGEAVSGFGDHSLHLA
jgi:hypothetical protein